jgi:hypothetical protein
MVSAISPRSIRRWGWVVRVGGPDEIGARPLVRQRNLSGAGRRISESLANFGKQPSVSARKCEELVAIRDVRFGLNLIGCFQNKVTNASTAGLCGAKSPKFTKMEM